MRMQYVIRDYVLGTFSDLFECRDGDIYFSDELKIIYGSTLRFDYNNAYVDVMPYWEDRRFRMILPSGDKSLFNNSKVIYVSGVIEGVIPDHICMKFFQYDIQVYHCHSGVGGSYELYDQAAIMRRNTIKEIIK